MNLPTQFSSLSLVMYKEQWTAPENHTNSKSVVYRTSKNTKNTFTSYKLRFGLLLFLKTQYILYAVFHLVLSSVGFYVIIGCATSCPS